MQTELLTILLGFLEGFALIISPCILPVLPLVLAGSLSGNKKRPFGIITGFTLSFALVAFFSRQLVYYSGLDLNLIRHISYALLLGFGLIMLSDYLTEKFNLLTRGLTQLSSIFSSANNPQSGFLNGYFLGTLIALIWTPCAGPILAAIIVQTVLQKTTLLSFFTLLAFGLGAALPMLAIALYGRKLIDSFSFFKKYALCLRKILGAIIIASVSYMIYQENWLSSTSTAQTTIKTAKVLQDGLWRPYKAPELSGIEAWINSPPLQLADLKGKVVLIDFWTYSCINCIRTFPYLKAWYNQYKDKGLVIIGIHSPEFDFEKKQENVERAAKNNELKYPIALDNQFVNWRNFNNHYWPAHYLINKQGMIVYQHFGEGNYGITENNIRFLLGLDEPLLHQKRSGDKASAKETPETYLGYARVNNQLSPSPLIRDKTAHYQFPSVIATNAWALEGGWQVKSDKIISQNDKASLQIHFQARKVFIVMGSKTGKPIQVKVLLNGKPLITDQGKEVNNSQIQVQQHSIYEVVVFKDFSSGILQLIPNSPGLEIYTFTFGS